MKTGIIVQARIGSTRLPGKILKEVLNKPLLEYLIERLRRVKLADQVIIATTDQSADQEIITLCNKLEVNSFCGSEHNVLDRYYQCAQAYQLDNIIRITSDCPLIDPEIIDQVIETYINGQYDYVANTLGSRTYPRGMDTEIMSYATLERVYKKAYKPAHKEHVTLYVHEHSELFRTHSVQLKDNLSHYRLTVDTIEDFELIKAIIEPLYPEKADFSLVDCIKLLKEKPQLALINQHINQKVI